MADRRPAPITTITNITYFDTKRAATDIPYARSFSSPPSFVVYSEKFIQDVIGDNPQLSLVSSRKETNDQFAHEAGKLTSKPGFDIVSQPNGACNYQDKVLYCAQGDIPREKNGGGSSSQPSALTLVDPVSGTAETLLNNFYGREFSSLNDVVVHHGTGDIWFTDPTYGYEQGFRPPPVLPKQVYRFRPSTGQCWAVADGFDMCNGLCFNPDYTLMYITDTGSIQSHGDIRDGHNFSVRGTSPASIYVYDVVERGTRLGNRRLFAFCDNGVPDGIKCDERGYVYSACGDGVHVWDTEGSLVGKIVVGGTTANFCFDEEGIWMFAEEELWFCKLKARGALLGVNWNE
ncbi:hypothetical protein EMPG_10323 [Blastomyces silverae]|uniref:SMP-30/Gluconolactonase/LRE-like region domain-containing protein n=1 Tax=Blastomyces silverae TaxID=2060906 RepID=A0A0H1B483_9EURO|nr:hypothetical protein EMPG_10323 [Blastomyces silverae]